MSEQVRRSYVAPKRAARAAATRQSIVRSARRLFADRGYGATSLAEVAAEAGVAVQTVYATFGNKRAILSALIDAMEVEADLPELMEALSRPGVGARDQLALIVSFNRKLWERALDVLEIVRGAGATEPELGAFHQEGEARRRAGQAPLVSGWASTGALRRGLTAHAAADVLWTLSGPDVYRLLVVESGWPGDAYESWLKQALREALLSEK